MAEKITPSGCKLGWNKLHPELYTYSIANNALSLQVRQVKEPCKKEHLNMFELIMGMSYWSRDNGTYFDVPEKAMRKGEKLAGLVCAKLVAKLGEDV